MAQPRDDISFEQVWRALRYDPETGIFEWKHRAYNEAAARLHGEFARLNVIPAEGAGL